jgi:branched-chain amino acid transport system ATP-binding protein
MGFYEGTGSVELNGKQILGVPTHKIVQSGVAFVPEDREVFASLTVKENLSLAARSKDSSAAYKFVYDLFPELDTRAAQQAGSLSGGQQQMVAIARALLNKNEILLVDEPTKGLAPKLVTEVAEALTKVAEQSTMLLVEQNLALVKRVAQHVIVMDQGRVVYQGGPENLNDESWVHQMLGVSGGHK